ncbi:uncharacterized protein LOC118277553 isoform X4 [Spodoptera frugiperda]|uniref:Oxysterol-binding protein n=1 Tax=Spodoptera frugiperda TaxID=7108 RepID=A0A9R0ER85_SPOFR|nr:uncharacterized protein LOC118277553 isoform X4 [Spodoptera frugiperda]
MKIKNPFSITRIAELRWLLVGACSGTDMNQGGVKNVVTEPTRLENKRERRRGAAGRAAALRRAPSDSDCSGETASLSADSGDRAPRPPPQPTRAGKNRGRRRGSEWEVLEGLKDGQRFEKRPDVFNGYLHKKRKWPLKGWHKRFFVVDGGILVYARSPTDVARGRLHGSVDVGLSVISAKARRRRIDIDADEFIYHLRAKTPDVFRTWLNVLKAHRLYRQHLLTFGARESVPKIHAPLEDLPPTDNSSRTSHESLDTSSGSSDDSPFPRKKELSTDELLHSSYNYYSPMSFSPPIDEEKEYNTPTAQICETHFNEKLFNNHRSLCSMNCVARFRKDQLQRKKSPNISVGSTEAEKQIHSTDLDINSIKTIETVFEDEAKTHRQTSPFRYSESKQPLFSESKVEPTAAYYFFTRNKSRASIINSPMKRSKKSTNLVKYRNYFNEPTLRRPLSKCMLLGKYKMKPEQTDEADSEKIDSSEKSTDREVACETVQTESNEVQVTIIENKALQDAMTTSDYDNITERLMVSIFENAKNTTVTDVKVYIQQVIKDLYDVKFQEVHPVKALFRSLLEYWLKNTTVEPIKTAMRHSRSIDRQSNKYFTKDENLSSVYIGQVSKQTQFHGLSEMLFQYKKKPNTTKPVTKAPDLPPKSPSPRRDTESFEKERRIQELERLLKNTVYMCETTRSNQQRDIKTTKTLINNIGKMSPKMEEVTSTESPNENSNNSSTEKIQQTLNHLISDTSISPDVAREFFSAYLDVLLKEDYKSLSETSSRSSEHTVASKDSKEISCQVQTEAVTKTASKSITTLKEEVSKPKSTEVLKTIDPGQLYLKELLERITTIFSKVKKMEDKTWTNEKQDNVKCDLKHPECKDELGRPVKEYPGKNLIYENYDDNSVVIDLSKYDLEHISMYSDPKVQGIMSISIKLKEKPPTAVENKHAHLSLQFADSERVKTEVQKEMKENWLKYIQNTNSNEIFKKRSKSPDTLIDLNKEFDLKPYSSSSDATSKAYKIVHESEHSIDLSFKSSNTSFLRGLDPKPSFENENTSCYIMSFNKEPTKFQPKKKVRLKDYNGVSKRSPSHSPTKQPELSIFEQPAPRVIDEKFILLLLENLSLLSKNIPSLHKDINNLFMKLRKKHEKILKNCGNIYGLSLLGKIYNEDSDSGACRKEISTQWDVVTCFPVSEEVPITKKAKNTFSCTNLNLKDANISAIDLKLVMNSEVQTKSQCDELMICYDRVPPPSLGDASITGNVVKVHSIHKIKLTEVDKKTNEHATAAPNWIHKITKECSMTTLIKRVLDPEAKIPSSTKATSREYIMKKKKNSSKLRQDLIKEIALLSPSFKVSTQSQTDRRLMRFVREKWLEKDFKVYQLFHSKKYNVTRASSATDSNIEVNASDELKTLYRCSSDPSYCSGLLSPTGGPIRGPQAGFVSGTPGGRLSGWIIESGGPLENASRELGQAQLSVQQLQRLLDALELQQQLHHDTDVSLEGASPNVKKDRRKFGLRKKKSNSKCASVELQASHIDPSSSHMALSALTAPPSPGGGASSVPNSAASLPIAFLSTFLASTLVPCAAARPQSLPGAETLATAPGPASLTSLTPDHQLREDFTVLAKDLVANLKTVVATLVCERGRLRAAMDAAETASTPGAVMAALRTNLTTALQQNSVFRTELRSRLSRIHDASDLAEISSVGPNSDAVNNRQFQQSLSYSSSCVSASEFFDAEEHDSDHKPAEIIAADESGVIELEGDSSSEAGSLSSEEGSASSDNSDVSAEQVTLRAEPGPAAGWSRRTRLPSPRPTPGGPSLWNLLYKNIGKDLSQISMPVTINEPLNMLQRLCEELEYSELLDSAAECKSPIERMALIAAFAVSAYASSAHRAASKPFNPLLAETYECVRDDKGFRFIAEQVSHHPPISACHAESSRWCFWQEARIKTKFWGKSMEFQPTGRVHVKLLTTGDHYSWNKVTTCVHNLFGGQRWVDQYGDMHIACHGTDITCKLNFIKASSWSSSRHEVRGMVQGGGARLRLAGRWSEALYAGDPPAARCLWRPGAMPPEHELYYGFTRFAMELNELEPAMRGTLPHTDTRLRPDQRALEEGDVEAAEQLKHQLEQAQRDRRRDVAAHTAAWFRKTLESGEETWVFNGEYWKAREAGFPDDVAPAIW